MLNMELGIKRAAILLTQLHRDAVPCQKTTRRASQQKPFPAVDERKLKLGRYAASAREVSCGRRWVLALLTPVWPSVSMVTRVCRFLTCRL